MTDPSPSKPAILALRHGDAPAIRSIILALLIFVAPMTGARSFVEVKLS
jgi:hypothetical protein